jgi:ferrochelatase
LVFVTSALSSYSGCRQYQEDLERARALLGESAPQAFVLRRFYNHPHFIGAAAERLQQALAQLGSRSAQVVFTAHSIPCSMSERCDYVEQFSEAASLVAGAAGIANWSLAYQSRSGSPGQPWLGPDILDELDRLASAGVKQVALCPIGFVSDHMEVVWDLDVEAKERAAQLGLGLVRAGTVGTHPRFVAMIVELVDERLLSREPRALGRFGPRVAPCQPGCCPAPVRR